MPKTLTELCVPEKAPLKIIKGQETMSHAIAYNILANEHNTQVDSFSQSLQSHKKEWAEGLPMELEIKNILCSACSEVLDDCSVESCPAVNTYKRIRQSIINLIIEGV